MIGELADLDNYMHDNPDLVTPDLVMLQVLSIQATSLLNAFLDTLQKNEDTA